MGRILARRWLRVLAALVLIGVLGPLLLPPPGGDYPPATELGSDQSRWLTVNGVDVHYQQAGAGDEVFVLLHGFGASLFSWREIVAPLRRYGRVLAYDRPGFGLTGRPRPGEFAPAGTPYGAAANVPLLAGLLDALAIERATLVGNSAGGALAVHFALAHPARASRLILVAPAVGVSPPGLPGWARWLGATPQGRRLGPWIVRALAGRLTGALDLAWADPSRITPAVRAGYELPLRAVGWERGLWEVLVAPPLPDPLVRLGELSVPVLYVAGGADQIVPPECTRAAAAATPGAWLREIPGCGHLPHEECPGGFMAALREFLDGPVD